MHWTIGDPTAEQEGKVLVVRALDARGRRYLCSICVYVCPEYGNVILETREGEDFELTIEKWRVYGQ